MRMRSQCGVIAALLAAVLTARFASAQTTPGTGVSITTSANDVLLSFPTQPAAYYTVETTSDLLQPWTAAYQVGVNGDGTPKTLRMVNALLSSTGFYRIAIEPTPLRLVVPQANAFAVLGHSCGGIKEQVYATGFDAATGYPTGTAYLTTTCSTGGRGSRPVTFSGWVTAMWDFAGNEISQSSGGAAGNPNFSAVDAYHDVVYNVGTNAYLIVPVPAAPTIVSAAQSGDAFQVSWTPNGVNPLAVTSSTLTAAPVNSAAPVLTAIVDGTAMSGVIPLLQPQTTYQVTVSSSTIGGFGAASEPVTLLTVPATIPPSQPTITSVIWANQNPVGPTDTLVATWSAPDPGNSPIDQYEVTITDSDGGSTFTQDVPGATLSANFTIDWVPNWSTTVRAHNAAGWGPLSQPVTVGGL